jgi:hypothetical protein
MEKEEEKKTSERLLLGFSTASDELVVCTLRKKGSI